MTTHQSHSVRTSRNSHKMEMIWILSGIILLANRNDGNYVWMKWMKWKLKFKATKCVIYRSLLGWAFCQEPEVGAKRSRGSITVQMNKKFVNYFFGELVRRLVPENMCICDELTICWSTYSIDTAESCVAVNGNYHIRFSASHLQSCQHGAMERYNAETISCLLWRRQNVLMTLIST